MRRDRMQKSEGYVGMAIVVAGLDEDGEFERAAALWESLREGRDADRAPRSR
jgi:hypothetical protein